MFYRYPRGGTKIGRAMDHARRFLFNRSRGRKKVLIVMTDGRSQDRVRAPAQRLKRQGVKIFALGIGRKFNRGQLYQIASSRRYVFTARFKHMGNVIRVIKKTTCRVTGTPRMYYICCPCYCTLNVTCYSL